MKKSNTAAVVISITALAAALAALAVGIIALVKSCRARRLTAAEYSCFTPDEDNEDEENIGSDTLAF